MPGAAVATTSSAPDDTSRLRDPRHAVVAQVLEQRVVGRERAAPDVGGALRATACGQRRPRRRSSGSRPNRRPGPTCPRPRRSASTARTAPRRGRARPMTVVLPTPPFPATMTRRDAAKNCAGSTVNPSERACADLPRGLACLGILLVLRRRARSVRGRAAAGAALPTPSDRRRRRSRDGRSRSAATSTRSWSTSSSARSTRPRRTTSTRS